MVLTQLHPGEMGKQLHFTGLAGRTKFGIHEGEKAGILEQGDKKGESFDSNRNFLTISSILS